MKSNELSHVESIGSDFSFFVKLAMMLEMVYGLLVLLIYYYC